MNSPSNVGYDNDERVDLPSSCSKSLYEWVVFHGFFIVCGIWESIVAICEFYELYDIWWGRR